MHTNKNLSNVDVLQSLQIIFNDSLDETSKQINMLRLEENSSSTKSGF